MSSLTLYRVAGLDIDDDDAVRAFFDTDRPPDEVPLRPGVDGRLFLATGRTKRPDWAGYVEELTRRPMPLPRRASVGAVLFLPVDKPHQIVYAATWGAGHFLLPVTRLVPDLGIRTALNLLTAGGRGRIWDPERIRALRTKTIGPTTLISQIQASRRSSVDTFPIRIDADQLRQVTGVPTDHETWGQTITGGVSLHVKRPERADDIATTCRQLERVYASHAYRRYYPWFDNVAPVNDPSRRERVLQDLVGRIRAGRLDNITLSPPDLVNWESVDHFEIQTGRDADDSDELSAEALVAFLERHDLADALSVADLSARIRINAVDSDGQRIGRWSALQCLTFETSLRQGRYILDEGTLFEVQRRYLESLNDFVDRLPGAGVALPHARRGENEGSYNRRVATHVADAVLMDKETITRPGRTAIEVCDVVLKGRVLLHVKKGTSSASLSHLFSQGVVSADLLHMDPEFGAGIEHKFASALVGTGAAAPGDFAWLWAAPFPTGTCEVGYAIMTGRAPGRPSDELPFFSKVNLRQRCEDLRRMGFRYSLTLIPTG